MENQRQKMRRLLLGLGGLFAVCFFGSFLMGRYAVTPKELVDVFLLKLLGVQTSVSSSAQAAVWGVRLPRVIAAAAVGASLSMAGLCYQGLFRNPMVSPDVLGASAGAGFGAALGILLGFSYWATSTFAFGCGIAAVALVWVVAAQVRQSPIVGLVLGGIMVSSLFSSGTSFIKLVADPNDTLPEITYWLMGSLSSIRLAEIGAALLPMAAGAAVLFVLRWRLNLLTLSEEEAQSLGINTRLLRAAVVLCATLMTAACVSVSGMIGWVGLVIPHFVRMIAGYDYRVTLPASLLLGASFMVAVDDLSRTLTTSEIPLGILTAFVGAPFFLYLMIREGRRQ